LDLLQDYGRDQSGAVILKTAVLNLVGDAGSQQLPLSVTETEKPVTDWMSASRWTAGVGGIYAGTFTVDGPLQGQAVSVTGSFAVCHVANLPDDSV
jgi:hypothetical protein